MATGSFSYSPTHKLMAPTFNSTRFHYLLKVLMFLEFDLIEIPASVLMDVNNLFALMHFHLFTRLLNAYITEKDW